MRNRAPEWALLRAFDVDMDPLMVARRVREGIHPLLVDHEPVARAEILAHCLGDFVERRENSHVAFRAEVKGCRHG